ncbi:MAG TPA: hypothetical protein VFQ61_12370 [Polyangiaceae bacterium]|nr:hypothetical protein [Polyangiaceae bacterium]
MTEPKRWLNEPSALSPAERRALEAARRDRPNAAHKRAVWAAIAAGLPVRAGLAKAVAGKTLAATAAPATPVSAVGIVPVLIKPLLLGFALAGMTVGGVRLIAPARTPVPAALRSKDAAPRHGSNSTLGADRATTRPVTPPETTPPETTPPETTPPETTPAAMHVDAPRLGNVGPGENPTRGVGSARRDGSRIKGDQVSPGARELDRNLAAARNDTEPSVFALQEESHRLAEARRTLKSGQLQSAMHQLSAIESDYPNGILNEEREVLILETLSRLGKRQAARQRAERFIERFPKSPHLRAAQSFLE